MVILTLTIVHPSLIPKKVCLPSVKAHLSSDGDQTTELPRMILIIWHHLIEQSPCDCSSVKTTQFWFCWKFFFQIILP